MKKCSVCKSLKDYSEFYGKVRAEKYPDSSAGVSSKCKECLKEKQINYRKNNPYKAKDTDLKQGFGIDLDCYNTMFNLQEGRCAICLRHQSTQSRALAVDHNHDTGEIRGLLCISCNQGLGFFRDNIGLLEEAIEYLKPITTNTELAGDDTSVVILTKRGG